MSFAAICTDLEIIVQSTITQRQIYDITNMWNLKNDTNELVYKTEIENRPEKQTYGYRRENDCRGINAEFEINRCIRLYIE